MRKVQWIVGTVVAGLAVYLIPALALAQEGAEEMTQGRPMYALAKAFVMGVAAAGGALGQGRLMAAALEGIARNPGAKDQIFTPMILGLAFIESLVIFAMLIAFMLQA